MNDGRARPRRYLSLEERKSYRRLEDVVGCKWSAAVVAALSRGVRRPGELGEEHVEQLQR